MGISSRRRRKDWDRRPRVALVALAGEGLARRDMSHSDAANLSMRSAGKLRRLRCSGERRSCARRRRFREG